MSTEMLQILREDGSVSENLEPKLSDEILLKMFRMMSLVRVMDTRMLAMQRQGRIGFYVPSFGQEAAQVGSAAALEKVDWIFPAYREPGSALWRGYPLFKMLCQFMGNVDDYLKGRQMPNHFGLKEINFVTASSPVGTQIPQAVGAAWAAKIRRDPVVVLVYFGDGATSEGDFHVGMNFAGVFKVPCVFFCNNNQYAISVPWRRQTATETLAEKAKSYGFEGIRVDGNDVLAVYNATRTAVDKARAGGGPTMIEAFTYRLGPHSSSDDPTRYRTQGEVEEWESKDPILRFQEYLERKGLLKEGDGERVAKQLDEEVAGMVKEAEKLPQPPIEWLFEDVYLEMPYLLRKQLQDLKEEIKETGGRTARSEAFPL